MAMVVSILLENKELTLCSLHLKGSAEDDMDYIYGLGDLSTIINELATFSLNQIVRGDYNKNLLSKRSFRMQSMENAKFTSTILGNFHKDSDKLLSTLFFKGEDLRLKGGEWFDEYKISDHLGLVYKFRI